MTEHLRMYTPPISHAGAVRQQPDSAITDASAVANFLEAAQHYDFRHMGGVTFYMGLDCLGAQFLVALENDGHQAAIFRKSSFDNFDTAASPRGKKREKLRRDQQRWKGQYTQQARDHVQGLRDGPDTDPKRLDGAEAMLEIVDPDFPLASTDTGIEGGEETIETAAEFKWPPHE